MKFSLDGVQEARSSLASTDVFSVAFNNCRSVYPIRLIRPCDGYKYDEQEALREVINDINESQMILDTGVFDKLKRSVVKNVKGHSAIHPCEYCEAPAVTYTNDEQITAIKEKYNQKKNTCRAQIESLRNMPGNSQTSEANDRTINVLEANMVQMDEDEKKEIKQAGKKQLTWPASTMNGRPRTITSIRRIVNEIEAGEENLDRNYLKGIKGRSVLLDQPDYDFILDTPAEYMHLVCLGVCKRMIELTFKVGENRKRKTNRKLSPPSLYNSLIKYVKSPHEFSRRCRNLDFSVFKAQEFRNVVLFFSKSLLTQ